MAIPEYPITRREQYLDAIATNDTSVLPAEPITRTEQYLDAIARNGGGSSGGGVLVVHVDAQTGALDKTWQEIADAEYAVIVQSVGTTTAYLYIANLQKTGDTSYVVNAFMIMGTTIRESNYIATSADGYPVFNQG